jgi:hypothetical protein
VPAFFAARNAGATLLHHRWSPDQSAKAIVLQGYASAPTRYEYRNELLGEIPGSVTHPIARARVWDSATAAYRDTQWTVSWSDLAGRTLRAVMADGAYAENFFNENGQLERSVDPDGVASLCAYNARGERYLTAVGPNRNGQIDYAAPAISAAPPPPSPPSFGKACPSAWPAPPPSARTDPSLIRPRLRIGRGRSRACGGGGG